MKKELIDALFEKFEDACYIYKLFLPTQSGITFLR